MVDGDVELLQVGEIPEDGALGDVETAGDLADPPAALAGEKLNQFEDAEGTCDRQGSSFGGCECLFLECGDRRPSCGGNSGTGSPRP